MEKERVVLSKEETKKAIVITQVLDGTLTIREAAEILGLSTRHVKRLKKGVKEQGLSFLAHKNRGRKPKHAIPDAVKKQVVHLVSTKYYGANYSHIAELLAEHDGIHLSVSSVRRILKAAGIESSRKHKPSKRYRSRERMPQEGLLVQIDASEHAWLENRGPKFSLIAAIDDATGKVLGAVFRLKEDLDGYFEVLFQIISNYGVPLAIYSDRHSIFISPKSEKLSLEDELAGKKVPLTQFGRAISELNIIHFKARSPQAKGRIERLFGTFQDRLIIEMRLANISSIEEANNFLKSYLPKFNEKFAVEPKVPYLAYKPAPPPEVLKQILCRKESRIVSNGSTISFAGKTYQLVENNRVVPLKPKTKVLVHIHSDGHLQASYQGKIYDLKIIEQSLPKVTPIKEKTGLRIPHKPAPDHPWRRMSI